ncbi:Fe2OG dioxygenase domain-containing protein [Psidium guajava]|nr:Fe2OG dioxygenase domain-containing protein [Psidium guajava]
MPTNPRTKPSHANPSLKPRTMLPCTIICLVAAEFAPLEEHRHQSMHRIRDRIYAVVTLLQVSMMIPLFISAKPSATWLFLWRREPTIMDDEHVDGDASDGN